MQDHLTKQVERMPGEAINSEWYTEPLTWQNVDPTTHPFDDGQVLDVVREVVSAPDPEAGRARGLWSAKSVARGLAEHYGVWASGWAWEIDESPDSGAVIRELPAGGDGADGLDQQAQRYASALLQWRVWLEELAVAFTQFAPRTEAGEDEVQAVRERAVAPLVTLVVARTGAGETWRAVCARVLAWYLESTGMTPDAAEDLADDVVDSEFESWIAPDEGAVARAREAIGERGA
ncbi:hypothetical protein ACFRAO_30505 [Streptomyces sp. NPDC056656]|uniref:hypothetical protein n=1 Tax=Streptomyces sp. NPDC056656 TaxID=3345895 RepID=UPI0036C055CD